MERDRYQTECKQESGGVHVGSQSKEKHLETRDSKHEKAETHRFLTCELHFIQLHPAHVRLDTPEVV